MAARDAQRPRGDACSLMRAWSNADLVDNVVAYLPLPAIADLPMLCRRRRDEQPALEFRLARRHNTLRASRRKFLDEIRATGRDLRLSRFDGSVLSAWYRFEREDTEYRMVTVGGSSCIQITTIEGQGHDRGLQMQFDLEIHRVHRIRYRFSFTDSRRAESFDNVHNYGFAYLSLCNLDEDGVSGLMVSPGDDGNYELAFLMPEYEGARSVANVEEDTWYTVTMNFDWATHRVRIGLAIPGRNIGEECFPFEPSLLHRITIYNFSPSVSRYSDMEVIYPASLASPPPGTV